MATVQTEESDAGEGTPLISVRHHCDNSTGTKKRNMKATFGSQLKALLWRNFLLKKRDKKQLLQEIFFPIYFIGILAMIKALVKPTVFPAIPSFPQHSLNNDTFYVDKSRKIIATPNTTYFQNVMSVVSAQLGNISYEFVGSSADALNIYRNSPDTVAAGIFFNYIPGNNYSYAIRLPYNSVPNTEQLFTTGMAQGQCRSSADGLSRSQCSANQYLFSGFLSLQVAIDTALTQVFEDSSYTQPNVYFELMPKDSYTTDISYIQIISAIYFVWAYSFFINFLCVNLVAEKQKKIREGMKMMGLMDSVFWLSWGLTYVVIILVVTGIVVAIAAASQFFSQSNIFLMFLMLFLYGLSIITLAFMLTPFFNNARAAGGLASFASIVISLLYLAISMTRKVTPTGYQYAVSPAGQWVLSLFSPVALALAMDQGVFLDIARGGMNFDTITLGEFPLYAPIVMLVVDTVLYGLLAVYFDHVIPGEYGVRYKPWYFLLPSYWCAQENKAYHRQLSSMPNGSASPEDIEMVTPELANMTAIRINNITKTFKSKDEVVSAVDGLTIDMYEGQITALLGHNGAGKTTLINMLCGLIPPSSGTAHILGEDITVSGSMERIRSMCGICPQHNILYDNLSCEEHLYVFAGIKGVPSSDVSRQVSKALKDADLTDQAQTFAKNLSGGQKRKLSVAMALIGDPKIVFLDEPTAGMDPYSRRHLWSLLKNNKEGRVILLTTHFMDEADILADRKAIVSKGRLRCCGSSLFLKSRFGLGYHLNMVAEPTCDPEQVHTLLKSYVNGAELKRTHAKEVAFTLPSGEVSNFSTMFAALEEKSTNDETKAQSLGIRSYGVSMTTLEEVFLKLGEEAEEKDQKANGIKTPDSAFLDSTTVDLRTPGGKIRTSESVEIDPNHANSSSRTNLITDKEKTKRIFKALLKIRFFMNLRQPMAVIFMIVLPVIFVTAGCILNKVSNTSSSASDPKPLGISPVYAQFQNAPMPGTPNFVAVDDVDTASSSAFISGINSTVKVDKYTGSVNLTEVAPHFIGINLNDFASSSINFTALYNDTAIHSLPSIINLISTAMLINLGKQVSINATNLPWPDLNPQAGFNNDAFSTVILLGMAFILIPAGFAVEIVMDKQVKARSLLRVSGVGFNMYWGHFFVFHMCIYLIPAILCLIITLAAQLPSLSSAGAILSLILLFITYLPSVMMLSYVFSFAFDKYESAQAAMPMIFIFSSLITYEAVSLLDMLGQSTPAVILHYVFLLLIPPYPVFGGLYYIDRIYRHYIVDPVNNVITTAMYFDPTNHVLATFLFPILHLIWLYMLLRILDVRSTGGSVKQALTFRSRDQMTQVCPQRNEDTIDDEDEDVTAERRRVEQLSLSGATTDSVSHIQDLRKEFRKRGKSEYKGCQKVKKEDKVKVAVRNATFSVDAGEVFGLLGPNGAGKTTTMNMIIAEESPSRGKVVVGGYDVRSSLSKAFEKLGYCPQHDALWEKGTLKEHLEVYSAIKGLSDEDMLMEISNLITGLQIEEHSNKHSKKLSGGTKRKLSYAISMLGNPQVVLMDEPSTGMDPQSKRFLWDKISSSFEATDRGAILTTHYMEEADALCSRIAIMVNGKIECLGSTQHLKDKYGSGYQLEIKLGGSVDNLETRMNELDQYLRSMFPHAICAERFAERGQYKIPRQDVSSLAHTFAALEDTKRTHNVEEYSFSQATLEQVFLEFAKQQLEEGEEEEESRKRPSVMREFSRSNSVNA